MKPFDMIQATELMKLDIAKVCSKGQTGRGGRQEEGEWQTLGRLLRLLSKGIVFQLE